jgi:protein gp37
VGKDSKIEWTTHSFNSWHGCQRVSPGCEHCYAESLSRRWGKDIWGPPRTTERQTMSDAYWRAPLKWDKEAAKAGARARVFCASMADVFEDHPQVRSERSRLIGLINLTHNLQWLLLTKRPQNVMSMLEAALGDSGDLGVTAAEWLALMGDRVWVGTSVEDQQRADERIPHLMQVPATIRFLSAEPLLGPVDLWAARYRNPDGAFTGAVGTWGARWMDWVIVGAESAAHARPMQLSWAADIVRDCKAAGVPVFVKQVQLKGKLSKDMTAWPPELQIREFPGQQQMDIFAI